MNKKNMIRGMEIQNKEQKYFKTITTKQLIPPE